MENWQQAPCAQAQGPREASGLPSQACTPCSLTSHAWYRLLQCPPAKGLQKPLRSSFGQALYYWNPFKPHMAEDVKTKGKSCAFSSRSSQTGNLLEATHPCTCWSVCAYFPVIGTRQGGLCQHYHGDRWLYSPCPKVSQPKAKRVHSRLNPL